MIAGGRGGGRSSRRRTAPRSVSELPRLVCLDCCIAVCYAVPSAHLGNTAATCTAATATMYYYCITRTTTAVVVEKVLCISIPDLCIIQNMLP